MAKLIEKIETAITSEEIGALVITWDLEAEEPQNPHDEDLWWEPDTGENRAVKKIRSVELQLFDKVGLDITSQFMFGRLPGTLMKKKLLSWASDKSLNELQRLAETKEVV